MFFSRLSLLFVLVQYAQVSAQDVAGAGELMADYLLKKKLNVTRNDKDEVRRDAIVAHHVEEQHKEGSKPMDTGANESNAPVASSAPEDS
jgi:hypothetical protein